MQAITTVGLDIAKSVFQVHGIDATGNVIIRRQLKRRYVLTFLRSCRRAVLVLRLALHRIIGRASCRRSGARYAHADLARGPHVRPRAQQAKPRRRQRFDSHPATRAQD